MTMEMARQQCCRDESIRRLARVAQSMAAASSSSSGPEAAVAALSARAEAAVAATPEQLAKVKVTQPFKLNNVALKWIRDKHEQPPGTPIRECVDLTDYDPYNIGVMRRTQEWSTGSSTARQRHGHGGKCWQP